MAKHWKKRMNQADPTPPSAKKGSHKFLALARVSSREQQREGFSLDVQEEGLRRYAEQKGGEIVTLYRVAETASKTDLRETFKKLIAEAKRRAREIDAILFYKFDRAARNLFDFVELERLEKDYGVRFVSVSERTEDTPAGRMHRRMLNNIASFNTEQQSDDVREGVERRVKSGLVPSKAPFGYSNVRRDGRSLVEVHEANAAKVRRVFKLYAYGGLTLDGIARKLNDERVEYRAKRPKWHSSGVYDILLNRAYIGEVRYREQWHPGTHTPLVDRETWDRVQALLGIKTYTTHTLTYAGGLIQCAHCGHPITGERITKKKTGKAYCYYRCASYTRIAGHPRHRVTEGDIDRQVLVMFDRLRVAGPVVRAWVERVLRARTVEDRESAKKRVDDLERQVAKVKGQRDRLLEMRMGHEVEKDDFLSRDTQLRDDYARLKLQIEIAERAKDENIDVALKAFELSQQLREKWVTADYAAKRRILEIMWLNCKLDAVNLVYEMRKPFDVLAEGLSVSLSRADRI